MIDSLEKLDACLGAMPGAVGLKVIDHLDEGALRWLAASPLAFIAGCRPDGVSVTIAGGEAGYARAPSPDRLFLPLGAMDDPDLPRVGRGIGTLFLVPGVGETLRVNGRVSEQTADSVELAVDEVYVHCAKSLLRSDFWAASPRRADEGLGPEQFAREARFLALGTADAEGRADLSPKGDLAGNMLQLARDQLSYPERPGNRRKDSLRNLLAQPKAAAMALIPGSNLVATARGEARIVDDSASCAAFTVNGKPPKLVTKLVGLELTLRESRALARAALWPLREAAHGLDASEILTKHIKLNKDPGLGNRVMRKLLSKELMSVGLKLDYKHKLY